MRGGPKPPTWRDAPLSMAALMAEVPGGEFLYGKDQERRHLDTFWIDRLKVTNAQYAEFVRAGGAPAPHGWLSWGGRPPRGEERDPVLWVSVPDALAYAHWLGKDLPTEEEWEKAARGTDGRQYPWGNEWSKDRFSYYSHGILQPGPVGQHPDGASPYDVEDMLGDMQEWTKTVTKRKPPETYYVARGSSSWSTWPQDLSVTERNVSGQSSQLPHQGYPFISFRCVRRTPPPAR
jgi:formylglycine-generating enzyme required for sulfatase activity